MRELCVGWHTTYLVARTHQPHPPIPAMEDPNLASSLMSGLPEGRIVRTFSRMKALQVEARDIMKWFEDHDDGNQGL